MDLDLYGKIESILPFDEAIDYLHQSYIELILKYKKQKLLDIGCGNGAMLERLQSLNIESKGIDLSSTTIEIAKQKGLNAHNIDVCDEKDSFDVAIAVFDVINYIEENQLKDFFSCVENRLEDNGIFILDANTLFGFENVAQGTLIVEESPYFLAIDAIFEKKILNTKIDLFTNLKDENYKRETANIIQYFHSIKTIKKSTSLKLIDTINLNMYSSSSDKTLLIFKK